MNNGMNFSGMGTDIYLEADNTEELLTWFTHVERRYSRFLKDSELSILNQKPVSEDWISISEEFYQILQKSEVFMAQTDSLFNPYLGQQMSSLGYDRSFDQMEGIAKQTDRQFCMDKGLLLHHDQPLVKKVRDIHIDLGGFVKGWSADQAFQMARGENIFIDAGGDMGFTFAHPENIGVMNPFDSTTDIAQFVIQQGALATSNVLHRRWETQHGEHHHILNGQTGENPVSDVIQATVLAPTVAEAEVYAKVLCMIHAEDAETWIKEKELPIAALIVNQKKQIYRTEHLFQFCKGVRTAW
ncbi:FAD:protein FMN transferase [Halobacillus rhizosphaerae]|uniref:FAD:protein FMN transferase n=1 Tax=Halobacillus rhizosphaerae TaxID=3064889 RepID=UPI00398B056F